MDEPKLGYGDLLFTSQLPSDDAESEQLAQKPPTQPQNLEQLIVARFDKRSACRNSTERPPTEPDA
jgi:hypothetical protein